MGLGWVGVLETFLGRYVPPRFSKLGSSEMIFWLETGVTGTNFSLKVCVSGAEISPKLVEKWTGNSLFATHRSKVSRAGKGFEMVSLRS